MQLAVAVTLIYPKLNDSLIVAAASRSYYRKLPVAGCMIHEFNAGLRHAKTPTIDSQVCLIGSSNRDLRSFDLNYENYILLQGKTTTNASFERQPDYIGRPDTATLPDVPAWPWCRRIWNNVIATIGPVL